MAEAKEPAWLQLTKIGLSGALVLAGAAIGAWLTWNNKDRELDIRMVEIALSILKGDATENSRPAREYPGADTIDLDDALWREWVTGGDVPFTSVQSPGGWGQASMFNCYFPRADYEEYCSQFLRPRGPTTPAP